MGRPLFRYLTTAVIGVIHTVGERTQRHDSVQGNVHAWRLCWVFVDFKSQARCSHEVSICLEKDLHWLIFLSLLAS